VEDAQPPSPTSVILQLQAGFRPEVAGGIKARISLKLGAETFNFRITKKELRPLAAETTDLDLVLETKPEVMLAILSGQQALDDALAKEQTHIRGDAELARTFLRLFRLP